MTLSTYTGEKITPLGTRDVQVQYQGQEVSLPLLVVPGNSPSLLDRNWLEHIKLNWSEINTVNFSFSSLGKILEIHSSVFRPELRKLRDISAKLHIPSGAKPHFFQARPMAHSLKEKVLEELSQLQELGVITPVKHSEWAAPVVPIVKNDGSICLCGDYMVTIDPVLPSDTYPLP